MMQIAEMAGRLRRLAKRREDDGIYTDANLCEEVAAHIEAAAIPPGWPDPLESPQAEAIRSGKLDDTEIRNLFDQMERELRLHRERAGEAKPVAWMDDGTLRAGSEKTAHRIITDEQKRGMPATLRARLASCEAALARCGWYWPEDDTSSEMCGESAQEIVQNAYDWTPEHAGDIVAVARGGIVEVTYCASLPAADDADSDDDFWVEEQTHEAAKAKIEAEQARRAALTKGGEDA